MCESSEIYYQRAIKLLRMLTATVTKHLNVSFKNPHLTSNNFGTDNNIPRNCHTKRLQPSLSKAQNAHKHSKMFFKHSRQASVDHRHQTNVSEEGSLHLYLPSIHQQKAIDSSSRINVLLLRISFFECIGTLLENTRRH